MKSLHVGVMGLSLSFVLAGAFVLGCTQSSSGLATTGGRHRLQVRPRHLVHG